MIKFGAVIIIAVALLGIVNITMHDNAFSKLAEYYRNKGINIDSSQIIRETLTRYNGSLAWMFILHSEENVTNSRGVGITAYVDVFSGKILDYIETRPY